jgi:hypothetical protein
MNKKIKNWLTGDKDFTEGILLLKEFGKNKHLLRIIQDRPKRYAGKLEYELRKIAKLVNVAVKPGIPANSKKTGKKEIDLPGAKTSDQSYKLENIDHYPKKVQSVILEFRKLYILRARYHKNMGDIPDQNTPQNIAARKDLSDKIKLLSEKMDILWKARVLFDTKKIVPDIKELLAKPAVKEKSIDLVIEMKGAELVTRKKNLESSLTKDRNLLTYQEKTKQDKENQMPIGPKRDKILVRIKEKETELELINKKLDAGKD